MHSDFLMASTWKETSTKVLPNEMHTVQLQNDLKHVPDVIARFVRPRLAFGGPFITKHKGNYNKNLALLTS